MAQSRHEDRAEPWLKRVGTVQRLVHLWINLADDQEGSARLFSDPDLAPKGSRTAGYRWEKSKHGLARTSRLTKLVQR